MSKKRIYTQFHLRLFWSVIAVFVAITLIFFVFQYSSEKQFKTKVIHSRLLEHNDYIHFLYEKEIHLNDIAFDEKIRTTIIDLSGKVVFDSEINDVQTIENPHPGNLVQGGGCVAQQQ